MAVLPVSEIDTDFWKNIASEIRFRLQPKDRYYRGVNRFFLGHNPELVGLDPFDIEIPQKSPNDLYHNREEVSRIIDRHGSMIIYGKLGSGKTMLFNMRKEQRGSQSLLVSVSLPHYRDLAAFQPAPSIDPSPLNSWTLAYLIFNAFWVDFFCEAAKEEELKKLRDKKAWMEMLRWFYQHFPPMPLQRAKYLDFEMEAWLKTELEADRLPLALARDRVLEKLIEFVTYPLDETSTPKRLYQKVTLFVDGVDSLKAEEQKKLAEDVYHILELRLPSFELKAFINTSNKELFPSGSKYAYYPSNLSFYELPPWSEDDLRCLLDLRIRVLSQMVHGIPADDFLRSVFLKPSTANHEFSLASDVQKEFFDLLITHARRCYSLNDPCDAPLHLLRLVRGCLAYSSRQWEDVPNGQHEKVVLSKEDLLKLVNAYWDI